MKRLRLFALIGLVAIILVAGLLAAASSARAEPSVVTYDLSWNTIDGGGGTSNGNGPNGSYSLSGTIGQPDAGTLSSNGNTYTLAGGFWAGVFEAIQRLFLPLVRR
jgi:hypothetical protein